jgi:uncharacterized protein (TIGR03083 family)
MNDSAIRAAVVGERTDLAEVLAGLTPAQWDQPTLCAGWRVREVVAHMTMPFRMSTAQFAKGMIRARGDFNRMADRQARADTERMNIEELLGQLHDNLEHPWRPPGGGETGALSHDVIHGLDITVALGIPRVVPSERIEMILKSMTNRNIKYFRTDLSGVRLEATDIGWSMGEGEILQGRGQDLLLLVAGRQLPVGLVMGRMAARFTKSPGAVR